MPIVLPETPTFDDVTVPAGGDQVTRAGLVSAYQNLTNRDAWLVTREDRLRLQLMASNWLEYEFDSATPTMHAVATRVVGAATTCVAVGSSGAIQSSADGLAWTQRTADGSFSGAFNGVAASSSVFIAVGASGEIQRSVAGTTWAQRTPGGSYSGNFNAVAWASDISLFVAVGSSGEIQTSPDGDTWTQRTAAGSYSGSFFGVTRGDGVFVVVGESGEIQTSPDGITWTQRIAASGYSGTFRAVAHGGGVFVAVGSVPGASGRPGEIQTSSDGVTWSKPTTDSEITTDIYSVAHVELPSGEHGFIATGHSLATQGQRNFIWHSIGGTHFDRVLIKGPGASGSRPRAIAYELLGQRFLLVGEGGMMRASVSAG